MEIVGGCRLMEQLLLLALYLPVALLPQEQQLRNANLGGHPAYLMVPLAFQNPLAPVTQPKLLVETQALTALVSGLYQLEHQQLELADCNCVLMRLQT